MGKGKVKAKLTFKRNYASEPLSADKQARLERNLAKLVALAFASDHPELFAGRDGQSPLASQGESDA